MGPGRVAGAVTCGVADDSGNEWAARRTRPRRDCAGADGSLELEGGADNPAGAAEVKLDVIRDHGDSGDLAQDMRNALMDGIRTRYGPMIEEKGELAKAASIAAGSFLCSYKSRDKRWIESVGRFAMTFNHDVEGQSTRARADMESRMRSIIMVVRLL